MATDQNPTCEYRDTRHAVTRRQVVTGALVAAVSVLASKHSVADIPVPAATATPAPPEAGAPSPPNPSPPGSEAALLTAAVAANVGYPLTPTQTKEVATQLDGYPGSFGDARKRMIPEEIGPAFAAVAPHPIRRGRK